MPDTTTPAPAETTPPAKPRRARGPINAKYLDEIELVGKLVAVARLPENVPLLTARACPPAEVTELENTAASKNLLDAMVS